MRSASPSFYGQEKEGAKEACKESEEKECTKECTKESTYFFGMQKVYILFNDNEIKVVAWDYNTFMRNVIDTIGSYAKKYHEDQASGYDSDFDAAGAWHYTEKNEIIDYNWKIMKIEGTDDGECTISKCTNLYECFNKDDDAELDETGITLNESTQLEFE